jgi:exonuclease III
MRLTIASYNVRSIANPDRRRRIYKILGHLKADVFCLQETWIKQDDLLTPQTWSGFSGWSALQAIHPAGGVAILCRRWVTRLNPSITHIHPGRALAIDLKLNE